MDLDFVGDARVTSAKKGRVFKRCNLAAPTKRVSKEERPVSSHSSVLLTRRKPIMLEKGCTEGGFETEVSEWITMRRKKQGHPTILSKGPA